MVAANEFPELSNRFQVRSVPRIVVNRSGAFVGALPEPQFVAAVLRLAGVEVDGDEGPPPEAGEVTQLG